MSKAKHTPGPWRVQWGRDDEYPLGVGTFERNIVTAIARPAQPESCANARLIAAAPELLEALQWREQFGTLDGEDANERFERIAAIFYRETGHLRPGKDCPMEPLEIRQAAWDEWMEAGLAKSRAAITKATGGV